MRFVEMLTSNEILSTFIRTEVTALIDGADAKLDEADAAAKSDPVRLSHEEVFGNVRAQFRGRK